MIAIAAIIIILLLTMAYFFLKSPLLTSIATLFAAIIAVLVAFNFYEIVAEQLLSRGYGGQWAQPGCLLLLFVITLVLLRAACDQIVGANIEFGSIPKQIVAVVCGFVVGLIISGTLIVILTMSPLSPSMPYERFPIEGSKLNADRLGSQKSLKADGFVCGLFNFASKGSLSSKKSFDVYHADFLDQLHINRRNAGEERGSVPIIAGKKSIIVPPKNGVRINEDDLTIVRVGVKSGSIQKDGAALGASSISITPGQFRLVCKKKGEVSDVRGSAIAIYPLQYQQLGMAVRNKTDEDFKVDLDENIALDAKQFITKKAGRAAWMDFTFKVPSGYQGMFLEFRNNAIVKLPKPVAESPEVRQALRE
jgi:hypothetical protein